MRRCAIRICFFLVLGAIVNIAVAWGCVCWSDDVSHSTVLLDQPSVTTVPDSWPREGYRGERWNFTGFHTDVYQCSASGLNMPVVVGYEMAGWPFRSLWSVGYSPDDGDTALESYINAVGWRQGLPIPHRVPWCIMEDARSFPLVPHWPGFAINTVFYALVLWLLFAGPLALRRRIRGRRIRRGLCPKCAYDLRGSNKATVCPECGARVVG